MKFKNRTHLVNTLIKINTKLFFSTADNIRILVSKLYNRNVDFEIFFSDFWEAKNKKTFLSNIDIYISSHSKKLITPETDYLSSAKIDIAKYENKQQTVDYIKLLKKYNHSQRCYDYIFSHRSNAFSK